VLSVIIATWNEPGTLVNKPAWECEPHELAAEVWYQIKLAIENKRALPRNALPSQRFTAARFQRGQHLVDGRLPEPLHWRLDESLEWLPAARRYVNRTPFHIAAPGKYRSRPGNLEDGYTVENGFVMCGMHTQTHFRIPTMESANESARHAVNAILRHVHEHEPQALRRTLCETWEPDLFEFDSLLIDFQTLKDLDHKLVERGLPHVMEIMQFDDITSILTREASVWGFKSLIEALLGLARHITQQARYGG
jgi:hypothetical protein